MPAIKISKVNRSHLAHTASYNRLMRHLNEWIPLTGLDFRPDGSLFSIAIVVEEEPMVIFLYHDGLLNSIEYELQGVALNIPRKYNLTCSICGKSRNVEMTESEYKEFTDFTGTQGLYICQECWESDDGLEVV